MENKYYYKAIVYNRNNAHMSDFHDFLLPAARPQENTTPINVKIFMPDTFRRYKFEVFPQTKNIVFRQIENDAVFSINSSSKMTPKFDLTLASSEMLERIGFHLDQYEMILECEDKEKLNLIYAKLKMIISHKGFNEYFKPIKRLGKGAFATVYLIEHKMTKQRWAAKVFSREGQKLEFKGQQALENEIRTLRLLSHPNIIHYEGVYETENLIYLVTEYLAGGTLDQYMRNKSNLKGDVVITIINQVLQALRYLEANHIMHRDLKPENILLREKDSKWVLADFGLSAFIHQNHIYDKCGTLGYMAPEIISENLEERELYKSFCTACDLYSFGIIAYNLIFGALPFKVEVEGMFDRKMVWDAWKRSECEEVHPEIISFLKGLLQSNPSKRWSPQKALSSKFLNDKKVMGSWLVFNQKKIDERFAKILKMANIN